jgi:ABC-type nitrate/sulfonate/bicarbonate transport system substrate-binding protein
VIVALLGGCVQPPARPATTAAPSPSEPQAIAPPVPQAPLATPPPRVALTVGYGSAGGGYVPLWIAAESGAFAKYGLDVDLVLLPGNTGPQSLVAGTVPLMGLTGFASAPSMIEGADLVMIGAVVNRMTALVYGARGVDTPEALRGRRLGITRPGTLTHFAALLALREWGFQPERDVAFASVNTVPDILAALLAGAIDAGVLTDLAAFTAEKEGYPLLVDLSTLPTEYLATGFTTTRGYAAQHRDVLLRFLRGYAEGLKRYYDDKPFAFEMMRKYVQIDDPDSLERTYTLYAERYYTKVPLPRVQAMQNVLDDFAVVNPRAREVDASRLVDPSFVEELQREGFYRALGFE